MIPLVCRYYTRNSIAALKNTFSCFNSFFQQSKVLFSSVQRGPALAIL